MINKIVAMNDNNISIMNIKTMKLFITKIIIKKINKLKIMKIRESALLRPKGRSLTSTFFDSGFSGCQKGFIQHLKVLVFAFLCMTSSHTLKGGVSYARA